MVQAIVNLEGDTELIEALEQILIHLFGRELTIEFDYQIQSEVIDKAIKELEADDVSTIKPIDFIVARLQGEVSSINNILRMLIAQREGVEAETLDELEKKLVRKFVRE